MQQNPPPFRKFARERFDGTSIYAQHPTAPSGQRHENPSRAPLTNPQHIERQNQTHSRPAVEQDSTNSSPPPTYSTSSTPTLFRPEGQLQVFDVNSPATPNNNISCRLQASSLRQRRQHATFQSGDVPRFIEVRPPAVRASSRVHLSPYHLADDNAPRCVSQPNTPSFYPHTQQRDPDHRPPMDTLAGSPTLPGAGRRRAQSATRTGEANFTDEEFHLFVQATAGLGPDYESPSSAEDRTVNGHAPGSSSSATPTVQGSTWALRQTEEMPYDYFVPHQQELMANRSQWQRLEMSSSTWENWMQPPSALPDNEHDVSPIEDELPDYASSQAQAQAEQRVGAARRAQELQRRWRESHP